MDKNTVNLSELAEIMERLSKRPDDYLMQAVQALRELHRLKTEVRQNALRGQATLMDYWYESCGEPPDAKEHMAKVEDLLDELEQYLKEL